MDFARVVFDRNFNVSDGVGQVVVLEFSNDLGVDNGDRGLNIIINGTEDTAKTEEVLVFEIGPVGTTIAFDGDDVFAGADFFCNIEFDERTSIFAHTDFAAVNIDVVTGFDAVEVKNDLLVFGDVSGVDIEFATIKTGPVVFVRNVRRVPRSGPRVRNVRVDRVTVPLHLEVRRHLDIVPIDVGKIFRFEV